MTDRPRYVALWGIRPQKGYVILDRHTGVVVFESDSRGDAELKAAKLNNERAMADDA